MDNGKTSRFGYGLAEFVDNDHELNFALAELLEIENLSEQIDKVRECNMIFLMKTIVLTNRFYIIIAVIIKPNLY